MQVRSGRSAGRLGELVVLHGRILARVACGRTDPVVLASPEPFVGGIAMVSKTADRGEA